MRVKKPLDFDREIKRISAIADAPTAPQQLNLDELLPGKVHGWKEVQPTDYGYLARCLCGWQAPERDRKIDAYRELRRHLMRTPQGSALMHTLRRVGRAGQGA